MLSAARFLWNATRGHRLQPWKSEYIRWRIETYSGLHADDITLPVFLGFVLKERWRLLRFLLWTASIRKIAAD